MLNYLHACSSVKYSFKTNRVLTMESNVERDGCIKLFFFLLEIEVFMTISEDSVHDQIYSAEKNLSSIEKNCLNDGMVYDLNNTIVMFSRRLAFSEK